MPKWTKKWDVPGSNGKTWRVSIAEDGTWGCSCPVWKFRRQECHHIKLVQAGGGAECSELPKKPDYVLACVDKPTYKPETNELYIPLIGIPDAMMMQATICFYMLKHGFSMGEIREMRGIPASWSAKAIIAHVETHGEAEYPEGWYRH